MKLLFIVDGDGNGYVAAVDDRNEHRKAAHVNKGQRIELDLADNILSAEEIGFGDVRDSESGDVVEQTPGGAEGQSPADTPGGGNEGSAAGGQEQGEVDPAAGGSPEPGTPADQATDPDSAGANAGGAQGGQAPTGDGELGGETPSTSAVSEKPLYLLDEDKVEGFTGSGFEPSGLETPEGKTLYHYAGDTAGQSATGNADGVNVYADADDNEKPVQPATPAEGQETATA